MGAKVEWFNTRTMDARRYVCAWCRKEVESERGYGSFDPRTRLCLLRIHICPTCSLPTIFLGAHRGRERTVPRLPG